MTVTWIDKEREEIDIICKWNNEIGEFFAIKVGDDQETSLIHELGPKNSPLELFVTQH